MSSTRLVSALPVALSAVTEFAVAIGVLPANEAKIDYQFTPQCDARFQNLLVAVFRESTQGKLEAGWRNFHIALIRPIDIGNGYQHQRNQEAEDDHLQQVK